jgi:hypothetical protein
MRRPSSLTVGLAAALAGLLLVSCQKASQEYVPDAHPLPVGKKQLLGTHTWRSCELKPVTFKWTFFEERFEIKPDQGPIPKKVLARVLGDGETATRIEGKWQLVEGDLLLSEISTDVKGDYKEACVRCFDTAVIRCEFGDAQYVMLEN